MPQHRFDRDTRNSYTQYEGSSDMDWVDSSSSARSEFHESPHVPQIPIADVDLFNNLRGDIHSSSRYLRCAPSTESLVALLEAKRSRTPKGVNASSPTPNTTPFLSNQDLSSDTLVNGPNNSILYPAWTAAAHFQNLPSVKQIQDIFVSLKNSFGFQYDSMINMVDHLMVMLDSRSSRMTPALALLTLHADYIGGPNANYRKWYFAAQLDLDDAVGDKNAATRVAENQESASILVLQLFSASVKVCC